MKLMNHKDWKNLTKTNPQDSAPSVPIHTFQKGTVCLPHTEPLKPKITHTEPSMRTSINLNFDSSNVRDVPVRSRNPADSSPPVRRFVRRAVELLEVHNLRHRLDDHVHVLVPDSHGMHGRDALFYIYINEGWHGYRGVGEWHHRMHDNPCRTCMTILRLVVRTSLLYRNDLLYGPLAYNIHNWGFQPRCDRSIFKCQVVERCRKYRWDPGFQSNGLHGMFVL